MDLDNVFDRLLTDDLGMAELCLSCPYKDCYLIASDAVCKICIFISCILRNLCIVYSDKNYPRKKSSRNTVT